MQAAQNCQPAQMNSQLGYSSVQAGSVIAAHLMVLIAPTT
jgi:hypothetical protein